MKCCMKKIGIVFSVISAMLFGAQPVLAAENMDAYEMGEVITESIKMEDPICEITSDGKSAIYSYTDENFLKTKTVGPVVTNFSWQNNVLINESSNNGKQIDFEYAVVDGNALCTNITVVQRKM